MSKPVKKVAKQPAKRPAETQEKNAYTTKTYSASHKGSQTPQAAFEQPSEYMTHVNPDGSAGGDVHVSATVGDSVKICSGTMIEANCEIGDFVVIGNDCDIGENCQIHSYASIGRNTTIAGAVVIEKRSVIGNQVSIRAGVGIGERCEIGNGCRIAESCSIGDYVTIGETTALYSAARIGSHVRLGIDVVITASVADGVAIEDKLAVNLSIPSAVKTVKQCPLLVRFGKKSVVVFENHVWFDTDDEDSVFSLQQLQYFMETNEWPEEVQRYAEFVRQDLPGLRKTWAALGNFELPA